MRALALFLAEGTWWETFAQWVTAALWLFLELRVGEFIVLLAWAWWLRQHKGEAACLCSCYSS